MAGVLNWSPDGINYYPVAPGPQGPPGLKGDTGSSAVIIASFSRDPNELPPSGLIPANWDGAGRPSADVQAEVGMAIHHTPTSNLWSFVGTGVSAAGWQNVGGLSGPTGPQGPQGPEGPPADVAHLWVRWFGTQAQYDALGTYDPNTLYVVSG